MKYYLSSYRIGNHADKLAEYSGNRPLAYISNAVDHIPADEIKANRERNSQELRAAGISFEILDLRDFFSQPASLARQLDRFAGVWITGGNTFVLRQAMRLSGFDKAISDLRSTPFLYSGYSAGICILAPSLRALQIVDDPKQLPYTQQREPIWEGLNFLDFIILPHYKSSHPESADIDREVEYCNLHKIAYRTLSDGDVLYGSDINLLGRN